MLPQDPRLIGLSIGLQNCRERRACLASRERRLGFVDDEVRFLIP